MLAAVKVRGDVDAREKVRRTIENLNLEKKNQVRVMEDSDVNRGMLKVVKDYVTYGEIGDEALEKLEERNGEIEPGDVLSLPPPSGGYSSTKKDAGQGGSLGERENMEELIGRMV